MHHKKRAYLDKLEKAYETKFITARKRPLAVHSSALFRVFHEISKGNNYVTKIADRLEKSKAIVSRQVKKLVELRLVNVEGERVKAVLSPNWEVLAFYWLWRMFNRISSIPWLLKPDAMKELTQFGQSVKMLIGPITSHEVEDVHSIIQDMRAHETRVSLMEMAYEMAQEVALPVEIACVDSYKTFQNFADVFDFLSTVFAFGLPDPQEFQVSFEDVEGLRDEIKRFYKVYLGKTLRLLVRTDVFSYIFGANLIRRTLLSQAGFHDRKRIGV